MSHKDKLAQGVAELRASAKGVELSAVINELLKKVIELIEIGR